jgi:hypothetical protein
MRAPQQVLGGGHLDTPHLLRRTNGGETSIAHHRPPQKQTTLAYRGGLARPPASGRFAPGRSGRAPSFAAVELDQHFVHEQVNAGNAFDFYTAARNTIATGVIEAVIRPVGFNSPVPALTSN